MSLTGTRDYYKPFDHPWMFDYYVQQNQMHWFPEDVPLHNDVQDWQNLNEDEKNLLTQIFRLSIHQHAYSLLLDTVGMPEVEYKAFSEYEAMADKHEYIKNIRVSAKDKDSVAKALAVYSAFTEGLQLFSSFIILLNFPRFGKMKGMGQIITYSIRDESLHVEAMTQLFREYIQENIEIWTDDFKKEIYQACRSMVDLEDRFLNLVFEMGDIQGLTKKEMQSYIRYIADRRLLQLGLKPNYGVKENPLTWLDDVLGVEHQNFFEGRATSYMKAGLRGSVEVVNFAEIA